MKRSITAYGIAAILVTGLGVARAQDTTNPASPSEPPGSDHGVSGALKPPTPSERTNPSTTGAERPIRPPDPAHPFGQTERPPTPAQEPSANGRGTK
jgi:hypothetical protein